MPAGRAGRAGRLGIVERGWEASAVLLEAVLGCGACLLPSSPAGRHNELEHSREWYLVHLSSAGPTSSQTERAIETAAWRLKGWRTKCGSRRLRIGEC